MALGLLWKPLKKVANVLPILFVCTLLVYSFYFYVLYFSLSLIQRNGALSSFYIVVYNVIGILFSVSFLRAALTQPLSVPDGESFCKRCNKNRPERTHHCSWCERYELIVE